MHAWSMSRAIFILVVGVVAPFFCLSVDSASAAPHHPSPHERHHAELVHLEASSAETACIDAAWLPISKELRVHLSGDVAVWRNSVEGGETYALIDQPLSIPPDTARALLQVYRL